MGSSTMDTGTKDFQECVDTIQADFQEVVRKGWSSNVDGVHQFRVVKKLKLLKPMLRAMLFKQGNLHKRVGHLREELDGIQKLIDRDPFDLELRRQESECQKKFLEASLDEECFLKQKSKVDWLAAGDQNTAFFHNTLKSKNHRARIDVILDREGVVHEGEDVQKLFVTHYVNFLGCAGDVSLEPYPELFSNRLDANVAGNMVRSVTDMEIKNAMFAIGDHKAPGPDGYSAAFFKHAWPILGKDVTLAVKDFFLTGRLLQEWNHTLIALIPKVQSPSYVNDYRPIACCNVVFKCISKIVADRMKMCLDSIVSANQSAFVPGRRISDNILLTQELMHNYHRKYGPPRCAFKVDIQKAYDTVDWKFLRTILVGFGFHPKMVNWIMVCVTSTSFSISINGDIHGYFKGKRGLRQGDPLSPYLFTLVMEVLTLMLQQASRLDNSFRFHNKCEKQRIINLCFADDLFIFSRGCMSSVRVVMNSLNEFTRMSGLVPSIPKSTIYFCNVQEPVRMNILSIMPFVEGSLPVKYLGVPLISSRLLYKDCKILVEKLEGKILNWRNRMLSFAGRLQLILSVLSSMHIYWASVFILPARVILELEAKMRGFLWSQGSSTSRAKVSWKSVCLPKSEGGLGIRRIGDMNKSLMASHVWSILMHRKSLWVEWIHSHRLLNCNFWECTVPRNCCWSWRKILLLRPLLRQFFWVNIGNGISTSAWFDKWCEVGPLSDHITMRAIHSAGFSRGSSVADIYSEGSWLWPSAWYDTFPVLINIHGIVIDNNATDTLWWRVENRCLPFSASTVWDAVRYRRMEVNWVNIVWFSQCIPRHAFVVWLVMRGKLLTQDKIVKWDLARRGNMNMMCCLLCYSNIDSHSHLFFECKYANSVWDKVKERAGMSNVRANWNDITSWLCSRSKSRSLKNVVARLLVAGTVYYIWQERNNRLFNNHARPPDILSNTILDTIRYRLMGLKLKQTEAVVQQLAEWKIDVELYDQVDG
ncbi:hypothetical protein QVD17_12158 [Tagetes erecta]|uniref:Reverse transcriptase domain-containing protein n=1 Tax=Tagetes erecta TaxID=13708 RepID=A0AAD8P2S3_TARER|nr:hypothetical protein QVD17_12158 [Tagetes erecta]